MTLPPVMSQAAEIAAMEGLFVDDPRAVTRALGLFREDSIGFADALIPAAAPLAREAESVGRAAAKASRPGGIERLPAVGRQA